MAAKQYQRFWNQDTGSWQGCTQTGWKFNEENSGYIQLIVVEQDDVPHCGEGFYNNLTRICVWADVTRGAGPVRAGAVSGSTQAITGCLNKQAPPWLFSELSSGLA